MRDNYRYMIGNLRTAPRRIQRGNYIDTEGYLQQKKFQGQVKKDNEGLARYSHRNRI